jgi:hypothetical protein
MSINVILHHLENDGKKKSLFMFSTDTFKKCFQSTIG